MGQILRTAYWIDFSLLLALERFDNYLFRVQIVKYINTYRWGPCIKVVDVILKVTSL